MQAGGFVFKHGCLFVCQYVCLLVCMMVLDTEVAIRTQDDPPFLGVASGCGLNEGRLAVNAVSDRIGGQWVSTAKWSLKPLGSFHAPTGFEAGFYRETRQPGYQETRQESTGTGDRVCREPRQALWEMGQV
jgi:hypothetical protein